MTAIYTFEHRHLPPAFKQAQELSCHLADLNQAESERLSRQGFSQYVGGPAPQMRQIFREKQRAMEEKFLNLFTEIFIAEADKGNFEVLESPNIYLPFCHKALRDAVSAHSQRDRILTKLFRSENNLDSENALTRLLIHYDDLLTSATAAIFWENLKKILPPLGTPLTFEDSVSAAPLSKLFSLGVLNEDYLAEVSHFLFARKEIQYISILFHHQESENLDNVFKDTLRFKANPFFVRRFNYSFFKAQLQSRGIDKETSELLIESWDRDFTSFLDAAESLSAEK